VETSGRLLTSVLSRLRLEEVLQTANHLRENRWFLDWDLNSAQAAIYSPQNFVWSSKVGVKSV